MLRLFWILLDALASCISYAQRELGVIFSLVCSHAVPMHRLRRVFDQDTPPGKGVLINPDHLKVDWADSPQTHGKAVYRSLSEGRWLITVTGDGSLGLAKATGPTPPLAEAPPIRGYEPLTDPLPDQTQPLGAADVVERLINPNSP